MPRVNARDCAEAYIWYVAQAIPQIDAEIAENGHLWMETSWFSSLPFALTAKVLCAKCPSHLNP